MVLPLISISASYPISSDLFGLHSPVTNCTLSLIWMHVDSAIDGVNEAVCTIFSRLLKLHQEERKTRGGTFIH